MTASQKVPVARSASPFPGLHRGGLAVYGKVRRIPQRSRALPLALFPKPSDNVANTIFLRGYHP